MSVTKACAISSFKHIIFGLKEKSNQCWLLKDYLGILGQPRLGVESRRGANFKDNPLTTKCRKLKESNVVARVLIQLWDSVTQPSN